MSKVYSFSAIVRLSFMMVTMSAAARASDPVGELAQKVRGGEVKLEFDSELGYLPSLLKNLNVPRFSQTLVFSKTSLQSYSISPETPRAIYFNDDVYVGWVQGSPAVEFISIDPQAGAVFYLVGQEKRDRPIFERSAGHECSICHYSFESKTFVPRLLMRSVVPDTTGSVEGVFLAATTDQTPFDQRFGGWYVTGAYGDQKHVGNIVLDKPASVFEKISGSRLAKFDPSRYLSPHSDVVALMVLAHQVEVQNLIALASSRNGPRPEAIGERLVKALTFDGAAPLKGPIQASSNFAAEFASRGPLREFDLKTKLFKSPVSYLIYSKSFEEMPTPVKAYVHRRLKEILPDFPY